MSDRVASEGFCDHGVIGGVGCSECPERIIINGRRHVLAPVDDLLWAVNTLRSCGYSGEITLRLNALLPHDESFMTWNQP